MRDELTRGGRKLEAAMAHFGLAAKVRGCHAVDVGASTGGFVAVLLSCGAKHVTAVDVGHGQLDPGLAADDRVENLERVNWKTLALARAPGPFDFFTVDVSFVAARNILRGLAFRLRDGAEGVVLVKPQFELPSHLVKGGRVEDPALRARSLAAFRKKAEALGFALLGHMDSPVPGGSGTVEILVHLCFAGRPSTLPRPERKPLRRDLAAPSQGFHSERVGSRPALPDANHRGRAWEPSQGFQNERVGSRPALPDANHRGRAWEPSQGSHYNWFAAATPGLEEPLRDEVERLADVTGVRAVPGGVEFRGPLAAGMAANLHLRIASRVVVRLGQVKARDFAPLRRKLADLPWARFLPPDQPLRVDVSTRRCRLYHTKALAETLERAVRDRLGALPARLDAIDDKDESADGLSRVLLRGEEDCFTVSVDSSGDLLHRRGWRLETGRAPLRETLAAGILALCNYEPGLPFLDPMCGSGTIVLEACAVALARAPGLNRSFAFEAWPCFDAATWGRLRAEAEAAEASAPPSVLVGSDQDAGAIDIARRNAERAGLHHQVRFEVAAFSARRSDGPSGLVIINPPYGRRLGERGHVLRVARDIGRVLSADYHGWRVGVLCPDPAFGKALAAGMRRPVQSTHALRNGGLRVDLVIFDQKSTALAAELSSRRFDS